MAVQQKAGFTPGPWRADEFPTYWDINAPESSAGIVSMRIRSERDKANAQLIAAAPEMYGALRDQAAWIRHLLENLHHKQTGNSMAGLNGYAYAEAIDWDLKQKLQSLEEDIAKAEGR